MKTRQTILRAAAEVFDEVGFSAAAVRRIIKRARVTQGAMYFHFASKEDLAREVMFSQADDLVLPGGPDGLQRLIDITFYLARELRTNPVLRGGVRLAVEQGAFGMREERPYQQWADVFQEQLNAARERGELADAVDVQEVSWVLVSAFSGMQLFSQITTGREDLPYRISTLWRYLLPGVASGKARESLRLDLDMDQGRDPDPVPAPDADRDLDSREPHEGSGRPR
ncbi:ScbR family autoregulator-binding transcription factor [Streptomyces sp. NPDC000594]|uniref:ScbR family autoregulator-binding transcription factor n=1 Tax=Streptomyces sp. NPDC000594 TaxID=3154261 RepID=UPI00331C2CB2